jgi:hypothetical protein
MIKYTKDYTAIAHQDIALAKAIRENCLTRNDFNMVEMLEEEEGADLEFFAFDALLAIYKDLLIGSGVFE